MGATDLSVLPQRSVVFPETVFKSISASDIPLRVEGIVSQTGNLQTWADGNGNVISAVNNLGTIWVGGPAPKTLLYAPSQQNASTPAAFIQSVASDVVPLRVAGSGSQTADLQQWQNSAGTVLAKIGSAGQVRAVDLSNTLDTGPYLNLASNQITLYNRGSAGYTPFAIRGMSSQSGNLQEWQNSAGDIRAKVDSIGRVFGDNLIAGNAASSAVTTAYAVIACAADARGIVVRGAAGQSVNLLEFQNSSGTVLSYTTANGRTFSGMGEADTFGAGCFTMRSNGTYGFAGDIVNGGQGVVIRNMGTSGDAFKLWNSGNGNLFYVNNAGNVYGTGGYNALSDLSAKENIVSISTSSALESVTRLRPVKFDYIESSKDQLGFIAQEVAPVIPEAVSNFSEDQLALNDSAIIATLVAAVQELAQKVNALEANN